LRRAAGLRLRIASPQLRITRDKRLADLESLAAASLQTAQ